MIVRRVLFFVLYGVILLFCLATGSQVLYFVLAAMTGMLLLSLVSLLLVRLRFSLEESVEPAEAEARRVGQPFDPHDKSLPSAFPPAGGGIYSAGASGRIGLCRRFFGSSPAAHPHP